MNARREMGLRLVEELPTLDEVAAAKANAAEHIRRTSVALAYLDEMVCECKQTSDGVLVECSRHELEDILRGDK